MGAVELNRDQECLETYVYPESDGAPLQPSLEGWEEAFVLRDDSSLGNSRVAHGRNSVADFEHRLAEETQRALETGRKRGFEEGRLHEQAACAASLAADRDRKIRQAADLAAEFSRQRDNYFAAAEQEIVRLAMAVAARILRRQAQSDPLLLMGAVRVALGQMAVNTEVRILVPKADLNLWTEAIALLPNMATMPLVIGDDAMRVGECRVEAALGKAELSIASQLGEIQRGFSENRGQIARKSFSESNAIDEEADEVTQ
jgi:flagellar assembly protein FliH